MDAPKFNDSSRADLSATGLLFDSAIGTSAAQMRKEQQRNSEPATGLLNPDDGFDKQLGGPVTSTAIKQRSMQAYQGEKKALDFMQKQHSVDRHFQKLQTASDMVRQEMQMNYEKAMAKYAAQQARKRARGGVISAVLGTVGAVAGAVIGGAYTAGAGSGAGAAAGGAIGSAVGTGIGSMIGAQD